MEASEVYTQLNNHIRQFFAGHQIQELTFDRGPILKIQPAFKVLRISPGPKVGLWVYISMGAWEFRKDQNERFEFMLLSPQENFRCVELLAMSVYYHKTDGLGLGHTYPVGGPWVENATCDHFLISLPYTFGPQLELCPSGEGNIHIYWLLPITKPEREYKKQNGLDALESKFDELGLQYWRVDRPSVI
jgi:hypothetical protein